MLRLPRTKKRKTHNYMFQMEELGAYEALLTTDESAGGSALPESELLAHTCAYALACGGVRWRNDRQVQARRSLVDVGVSLSK